MAVFPVPDDLRNEYDGAGYAIALTQGGVLCAFRYIRDIFPNAEEPEDTSKLMKLLECAEVGELVQQYSLDGDVHVVMMSNYEAVEV